MPHQNEEVRHVRRDRSTARAHFHARLSRYGALFKEKWWVLVLGIAAGVGVQAFLISREPPSFASVGRMIVSIKLATPEVSLYTEELSNFLGTQAALMQSSLVINRAHARVQALKPGRGMHPVSLKVSVLPKTTIFMLQASGPDPEYTQVFLQACMDEYSALKKEMRTSTSDTTVAGLTEQVLRLEKDLRVAEQELVEFQSTNSAVLFQEQGNSAGNYLVALNQRLAALRSESSLLQMLTLDQNLNRQLDSAGSVAIGEGEVDKPKGGATERSDNEYLRAKQQVLLLKAEAEELGRFLRPKHPKMIAMSEEIVRREGLLKIYRDQGVEQLESRKASLALEIENLEKDVKAWDGKTLEIQSKTAEYQKLKANSQRTQALYDRLLATMQTLDVNKEVSPESVSIIEKASSPYAGQPELLRKLAGGGGAGFALSLVLLLLLDRMDDRMNSVSELQDAFDEDVLGQLPREKGGRSGKPMALIGPEDPRHTLVEAFRGLRSSLLYMAESTVRPRVILVTSAVPNDGKSFTAANLAITIATAGSRVLLVDADLRKGEIHSRFGLAAEPGLSEVLAEGQSWEKVVQPIPGTKLSVLTRGSYLNNSSELFINEVTKRFLEEVGAKFDYVVLDTVPVMAADDVTSLAPQVDGVLFVVRALQTSARVARAALDSLYHRQARILGLIFNAVPPRTIDYYSYKYRDYYYKGYPGKGKAKS
jgi:capsular exopolysaccharide synthesis family protein